MNHTYIFTPEEFKAASLRLHDLHIIEKAHLNVDQAFEIKDLEDAIYDYLES